MKFWDASALVPIVLDDRARPPLIAIWERDPEMIVWWGSMVECASAVARREHDGSLTSRQAADAILRLRRLAGSWSEIAASEAVRAIALRLLRVHRLRAADSLQLAAALVAAEGDPSVLPFVCLDQRLTEAAEREGFIGIREERP